MDFLDNIWNKAKRLEKRIVLPETEDPRILKAADLILKSRISEIILIGNEEKIISDAKGLDVDISKATIIDPLKSEKLDRYCEIYINNMKRRKHIVPFNDAKQLLSTAYPFFGALMVENGDADGMVSGASHSTQDTIKAAVYSVGLKEGTSILSSFFIMIFPDKQYGSNGIFFFADCAVIPQPDEKQLRDIAFSTSQSFKILMGKEPKIAMLSFSTKGSGKSPSVEMMASATRKLKEEYPEMLIDGEMQLDAAIVPSIGKKKAPESKVAGRANVLIFPNLDSGNIGYKIAERLGGAMALGPIFQGCAKPINDLSRGCSVDDIVNISAITAIQS